MTGATITIPPADGVLSGSYPYAYTWDEAGNPVSTGYPKAGGLDAETVTTGYDSQGLPVTLTSSASAGAGYVTGTSYGPGGRLTGRTLGGTPAAPAVTRGYTWDESTGNLAGVTTATRGGGQIQDDTYTYDPAGDLLSDHDAAAGQWQCYGYDQFPRLTQAWTARTGCGSGVRGYDPAQPGAYQQSYSYSIAGNTTALTTGTATATPQVTRYTYPGFSQPHPHAPVSVGAARFAYDRDGNLTRQVTGTTRQLYDWDPLSQLASVTSYQPGRAAQETSFAYDNASGDRLIRRDPDGTVTLYLPGTDLTDQDGQVTATRYYSISGTTIGTRATGPGTAGGVLGWLTGNPQGSPQYAITADGTSQTGRQQYLPYGALNGARTVKVTDRAFLGQPLDGSTGLVADGARYYNPATGQFISPDPVITPADPGTLNAYTYANDNPATQADPTGLMGIMIRGTGGCTGTEQSIAASGCGSSIGSGGGGGGGGGGIGGGGEATTSPVSAPAPTSGCGPFGLGCVGDFVSDWSHGFESTAVGMAVGTFDLATDPARTSFGCLADFEAGDCLQSVDMLLTGSPVTPSEVFGIATGTFREGEGIYDEATDGHPGEALGSLDAIALAAAFTDGTGDAAAGAVTEDSTGAASSRFAIDSQGAATDLAQVRPPGPYIRPSGATTAAQRAAVQGLPCVDCGVVAPTQVADHIDPLVQEYYRTGTIDLENMRRCKPCSRSVRLVLPVRAGGSRSSRRVCDGSGGFSVNVLVTPEQATVCVRFGAEPSGVTADQRVGIARNIRDGLMPVNGLRHKPEGETSGWYIWAGEELSEDPNFFAPLHVKHLAEWCPEVVPYLALPPGWRFLIAPGYEDVWPDQSLLQV